MIEKILIVVPTLNSYKLLPKLINSLQNQTCDKWQLLFIDGNSSSIHRDFLNKCCNEEKKCSWIKQSELSTGIFGAMNDGFSHISEDTCLLFWGSDDWAASKNVISDIIFNLNLFPGIDLLICEGKYYDANNKKTIRKSRFHLLKRSLFINDNYKISLFLGSTPPHQATIFTKKVISKISKFSTQFSIAADLDYFLKLTKFKEINVQTLNLEIVKITNGGISQRKGFLRTKEVIQSYLNIFGFCWPIPFTLRYLRRLKNLIIQ